jgi:uncharacterized protein (DUF1800 family)
MPISAPRARTASNARGSLLFPILASLSIAGCASHSSRSGVTLSPLPPAADAGRELTADQQVLQVLNRLTFGAQPGEAAAVREMGVDRWIARQLDPESINDRETDAFVAEFPTYREAIADLQRTIPAPNKVAAARRMTAASNGAPMTAADSVAIRDARRVANRVVQDVQILRVARAEMSHRELDEVLVDFWLNHFTVYDRKGAQMRYYLASYDRDVIRPHALGKFRDLLGAVAKSPAMLFYLDNWESAADSTEPTLAPRPQRRVQLASAPANAAPANGAPSNGVAAPPPRRRESGLNENYGRELLELHTLGVDGGYTQQDVINVARALTGWSIARPEEGSGFRFRPRFHDAGQKVVLGHVLPAGRGIEDGEDVLDIIARHPSTARYIARKLCQRFAGDAPPQELVDRAAATFTRTDGDIRQVVWTIVTSPEFYARAAYRSKVKSPFEVVVSSLRAMDAAPDTSPRTAQIIARMGEPIFGHQSPDGYPETGESWMNTGAILNRINFGLAVAAQRVPGATLDRWPESHVLMTASRAGQVDGVVSSILGGDASPDTRAILLSGEHPLLAASSAASIGGGSLAGKASGDPGAARMDDTDDRGTLSSTARVQGLAQVVGLALGAPEFQRR